MLRDLLDERLDYAARDGERFFDAAQNARVVANAERYYRAMYYGSRESWNLRDQHMFETLQVAARASRPGPKRSSGSTTRTSATRARPRWARAASSTSASCARTTFGDDAYLVGFGTDHGTVAAATDWDGPMERKRVRPAHAESYERLCHDAGVPAFLLPLREPRAPRACATSSRRRASSARSASIYRPETELASHYFQAVPARAVRRVRLVRRDPRGEPLGRAPAEPGPARDLPVRAVAETARGTPPARGWWRASPR